jgi:hypothetical protein
MDDLGYLRGKAIVAQVYLPYRVSEFSQILLCFYSLHQTAHYFLNKTIAQIVAFERQNFHIYEIRAFNEPDEVDHTGFVNFTIFQFEHLYFEFQHVYHLENEPYSLSGQLDISDLQAF